METIEFRQDTAGSKHPWRFPAHSMSDGTLRALGILIALFQGGELNRSTLVGIEEPEVALHPAAAAIVREALTRASHRTQVLVTSHSPEILDDFNIGADSIVAVDSHEGLTHIGPLNDASRQVLRERLFTPGELLKLSQLTPDPASAIDPENRQFKLFGGDE